MTPEKLLEAVTSAAQLAGGIAMRYYGASIDIDSKADGSPVTIADREAEIAVREWIISRFPDDGILGEELPAVNPAAARRWIIDPIDGTKSFVRGVPLWGSLVAVCEGDEVIAGAAEFPAVRETMAAARGQGCWWNGARCAVSTVDALPEALVLTTDEQFTAAPERRDSWQRVVEAAGMSRGWGDCYGYLLVATGRAEAMSDGIVAQWDTAAVAICVEEAGGVFTSWDGRHTALGGSGIATNAALDGPIRSLIKGRPS